MPQNEEEDCLETEAILDHLQKLLFNPRLPELPPGLERNVKLREIHVYLTQLRKQLGGYAKGDFSRQISLRGALAGSLKSLQANMLHLIWQMRQVEGGDFSQRVDFMGDFSDAFNKMVKRLDDAMTNLKQKEEELVSLANELEREVEKRGAALAALQKSEESFKYLAEHDPLTSLLNRRSFFARAEMQLAHDSIMGQPCCLALMDVDNFKQFNDTHGHLDGDEALRHIAELGSSTLRAHDIMGRYGGEEFVFLFPGANALQGTAAAERIRMLVETTPVTVTTGLAPVTASFGLVAIPPKISLPAQVNLLDYALSLADDALYASKSAGRNCVTVKDFPDEIPANAYTGRRTTHIDHTDSETETGTKILY